MFPVGLAIMELQKLKEERARHEVEERKRNMGMNLERLDGFLGKRTGKFGPIVVSRRLNYSSNTYMLILESTPHQQRQIFEVPREVQYSNPSDPHKGLDKFIYDSCNEFDRSIQKHIDAIEAVNIGMMMPLPSTATAINDAKQKLNNAMTMMALQPQIMTKNLTAEEVQALHDSSPVTIQAAHGAIHNQIAKFKIKTDHVKDGSGPIRKRLQSDTDEWLKDVRA